MKLTFRFLRVNLLNTPQHPLVMGQGQHNKTFKQPVWIDPIHWTPRPEQHQIPHVTFLLVIIKNDPLPLDDPSTSKMPSHPPPPPTVKTTMSGSKLSTIPISKAPIFLTVRPQHHNLDLTLIVIKAKVMMKGG